MLLGIQKKIDALGRIVLPKELRELYDIKDGNTVEIVPTENGIIVKKPRYKLICINDDNE